MTVDSAAARGAIHVVNDGLQATGPGWMAGVGPSTILAAFRGPVR